MVNVDVSHKNVFETEKESIVGIPKELTNMLKL